MFVKCCLEAQGNILRTKGKKFPVIIDDVSHYNICFVITLNQNQKK